MKRISEACAGMLLILAATPAAAQTEPDFAVLVKQYEEFGLPMPPQDSKLVRVPGGPAASGEGSDELAFVVEPGSSRSRAKILSGIRILELDPGEHPVPVEATTLKPGDFATEPRVALGQCLQLWQRGEQALARAVWAGLQENELRRTNGRAAPPEIDSAGLLAKEAWGYWIRALADPVSDRSECVRYLTVVARGFNDPIPDSLSRAIAKVRASIAPAGDPAWRFLLLETLFAGDPDAGEVCFTDALEEFAEADGKNLTKASFSYISRMLFRCESKQARLAFDVLMLHLDARQRCLALDGRTVWAADKPRRLQFASEVLAYIDDPDFYLLRNSSIQESEGMMILRRRVAYIIACALRRRAEETPSWTAEDWESYLERMRAALAEALK